LAQDATSYRRAAARGAYAAGMQQAVRTGLQILTAVVLSRILTPDTFGVYAMVSPIASFVALFQDMGLQQAVIRRNDITPALINRLYWINLAATMVVALVLLAVSPLAGWFYHDDRVVLLTAALAVPVVLGGLVYQHYAVMMRDLRFQRLAVIDICCALVQFLVVLVAAWFWRSYWAFWISGVASVVLYGILASRSSGWRPSRPDLRGSTDGMLRFGAHITGANLVGYFARNLDNVMIGHAWGPVQLGFYDRAYKLLLFPIQNINGPLTRIIMPVLSRLQGEPERMRKAYYRVVGLSNLLIMPGVAIAIAAPTELIQLLLGHQWLPTAEIFAWLGAVALFQPMTATMGSLLVATGRSKKIFWLSVIASVAAVCAFFIGLHDGGVGVARAYTIEEYLVRLPLTLWVVTRGGDVRARDLMLRWLPLMLGAGLNYFVAEGLRMLGLSGFLLLVADGFASYLCAFALLALMPVGRATLVDVWSMVLDALVMLRLRRAPAA
jgi:PST family polysaccharide transporter